MGCEGLAARQAHGGSVILHLEQEVLRQLVFVRKARHARGATPLFILPDSLWKGREEEFLPAAVLCA